MSTQLVLVINLHVGAVKIADSTLASHVLCVTLVSLLVVE